MVILTEPRPPVTVVEKASFTKKEVLIIGNPARKSCCRWLEAVVTEHRVKRLYCEYTMLFRNVINISIMVVISLIYN